MAQMCGKPLMYIKTPSLCWKWLKIWRKGFNMFEVAKISGK